MLTHLKKSFFLSPLVTSLGFFVVRLSRVFFSSRLLTAGCFPIQGVEDGSVDPGTAAPGRCSAPDAVSVRSAFPHRGATLSVPLDRGPAVVS